jgi:hypothetical protein
VGVEGLMVIRLDTEILAIGKGGTIKEGMGKGVGWGRGMGAAWFCGPFVCLGLFLLLQWRVLVSGIAGDWLVNSIWFLLSTGLIIIGR